MITTRESINYQFSLIFGYSSPNDRIVGHALGPGKLTVERVNKLSKEVLKYLTMYNAILRDYTGSEVFSIEFKLKNLDEKDAMISIYPKSMLLIPGNFKDSEALLLALKPETGFLDVHKAKQSVDDISELFFEVEEFIQHPELNEADKVKIMKKFAIRFSKKLYANLIEDKWNKKLVGLNYSLPTEKESLRSYESIKGDINYLWSKRPVEIELCNYDFKAKKLKFEDNSGNEHLKYIIAEPSTTFIVEKTLKLGADLLKLANTGTLDEIQDKIIIFYIGRLNSKLGEIAEQRSTNELIFFIKNYLNELSENFESIEKYSKEFTLSGEFDNLKIIIEKYVSFIEKKIGNLNDVHKEIIDLVKQSIIISISNTEKIRSTDLSSAFNYFFENNQNSIIKLKKALPKHLTKQYFNLLINKFISILQKKFDLEQKPSKTLGHKFIGKFERYLIDQIEISKVLLSPPEALNEDLFIKEFKKVVLSSLNQFFDEIELSISDLVSFAEIQIEGDKTLIVEDLNKFKSFSSELQFLLTYILRYSTINRFLKEDPEKDVIDPIMFINKFHRFLEKRFGGINLEWKRYVLDWLHDYSKQFFKVENVSIWKLEDTVSDLITYFERRIKLELKVSNFHKFLDGYITKIYDEEKKKLLLEFYKQYEYSIDIKKEFPKYIKSIIEKEIALFNSANFLELYIQKFFENNNFYDFIKEYELKYFSKLIPMPICITLKHSFSEEEKQLFKSDLFHVINFKYWHNKCLFEISDNFKEVYRDWLRKEK